MCECLKRNDGTWHVDECCAEVMDKYHDGTLFNDAITSERKRIVEEIRDLQRKWADKHPTHDLFVLDEAIRIVEDVK